jgi:hypothetical protein
LELEGGLGDDDVVRVVNAYPSLVKGAHDDWAALFAVTQKINALGAGLAWALVSGFFPAEEDGTLERLDEAVVIAGLRAAASNRPRGVLLIRGANAKGDGGGPSLGVDPAEIRDFLSALRVPFFYWRLGGVSTPDAWGKPTVVRNERELQMAGAKLTVTLRRQFMAWLEGSHMPYDVTTSEAGATPLRLAGAVRKE